MKVGTLSVSDMVGKIKSGHELQTLAWNYFELDQLQVDEVQQKLCVFVVHV